MNRREDYLRAVYNLTDAGESRTTTSKISEELKVTNASASEAVQKLEEEDMVCRAEYRGFTLSPMGKEEARRISKKHEKLERFFSEKLGLKDPEGEADAVEHAVSTEAIDKMLELAEGK